MLVKNYKLITSFLFILYFHLDSFQVIDITYLLTNNKRFLRSNPKFMRNPKSHIENPHNTTNLTVLVISIVKLLYLHYENPFPIFLVILRAVSRHLFSGTHGHWK